MPNPWDNDPVVQPTARQPQGGIFTIPRSPDQVEDRDFKRRDQRLQEQAAELARLKAQLEIRDSNAKKATTDARGGVDSTESERTAAFLATRVAGGIQDLSRIGNIGAPTLKDALVGGTLLGNYSTDEDRQRAINAQRDILDAALTLGTGAAYTKEQIDAYRASYFPQPGDAAQTVKDKTVRLQRLLEASRLKAGASAAMIDDALSASATDQPGLIGSVTDDSPQQGAPGQNTPTQAPPTLAPDNPGGSPLTPYQDSYIGQGMSGVNEGIASTLGAPVDLMTLGMNLGSKTINTATGSNIPEITRPFLGSEQIGDQMKGWGTYDNSEDWKKQFARRTGQSVGAAFVPMAGTAGAYAQAPKILGIAAAGGAGAAGAQQAFPNNPTAEFAGEVLGSGLGAGALASSARRAAMRKAIAGVPSRDQLRDQASGLYDIAESRGIVAGPNVTSNVAGRVRQIARDEELITPKGRVVDEYPRAAGSMKLLDDYAGENINPKQIQTVRRNLADSVQATEGNERRIAREMLKAFDEETVPLAPELAQARNLSSRYLQSDEITRLRERADVRAPQYSASGLENALRTEFRQMDRNLVDDPAALNPAAADAVRQVSRGTPMRNVLTRLGKLAPTGVVSTGFSAGVPFAIGNVMGGPAVGAAASASTMGLGALSRYAATKAIEREVQMADVLARNGGALTKEPALDEATREMLRRMAAAQAAQYVPR